MAIRTEPIDKRVRGRLEGTLVVETRDPLLVWQDGFPPVYGFAPDEVADGALRPATGSSYGGSFFFGPHLPVAEWYDVVAGDRVVPCGAWRLEDLPDRVFLTWEPHRMDWTEEDEPVGLHPRDPHKRVETLHSSRHVEVAIGGVLVATSAHPVLLLETDLPTRYYLRREDVRLDLLVPDRQPVGLSLQGVRRPATGPSPGRRRWSMWPGPTPRRCPPSVPSRGGSRSTTSSSTCASTASCSTGRSRRSAVPSSDRADGEGWRPTRRV